MNTLFNLEADRTDDIPIDFGRALMTQNGGWIFGDHQVHNLPPLLLEIARPMSNP